MSKIDNNNLAGIDLNLLVVLEALYSEQSVTKAGERIGLAQSSVSTSLTRLRHLFADDLFLRRANRMIPTARTEQLMVHILPALEHAKAAFKRTIPFDAMKPGDRSFTIAVTDYSGLTIIPELLSKVCAVNEELVVTTVPLDRSKLFRQLENGQIDAAIGGHISSGQEHHQTKLFDEQFVCITSIAKDNPWNGRHITMEEYATAHHIRWQSHDETPVTCAVDQALSPQNIERSVTVIVPHISCIPFVVEKSSLISTISMRLAVQFSKLAKIEIHPLPFQMRTEFDVHFVTSMAIENDCSLQWLEKITVEAAAALKSTACRK